MGCVLLSIGICFLPRKISQEDNTPLSFYTKHLTLSQKTPNFKKRIFKNPLSAAAFGQNKTLKLCQNNIVINTLFPFAFPFPLETVGFLLSHKESLFM
jgi:hypothetical protein